MTDYMHPIEYAYDVVGGVSVGGLNAGLLASFPRGQERAAVEYLTEYWVQNPIIELWSSIFLNFIQGLWKEMMFDTSDFINLYNYSFDDITQIYRALVVQSVDMNSGEIVLFDENDPIDIIRLALRATSAIPIFLPSVKLDGMVLIDG